MLFALSCSDFGVPGSASIQGNPGIHIPVGFISDNENARIADRLNDRKISEMVKPPNSASAEDTILYPYIKPNSEIRTYLIRYPIAEMKLNLGEYMKTDVQVPPISLPAVPAGVPAPILPISIPLGDMAALVTSVNHNESGIRIPYSEALEQTLEIKMSALGPGDFVSGQRVEGYLYFLGDSDMDWEPEENITLEVQLTGPLSGPVTITPELYLDWNSAVVKVENDNLTGERELSSVDFMSFFGSGVQFKSVKGYLYVNGTGDNAEMSYLHFIDADGITTSLIAQESSPIIPRERPRFPASETVPFTGELGLHSIMDPSFIDLNGVYNCEGTAKLAYKIEIYQMDIQNIETDTADTITADLVIELPLEFTVSTEPKNKLFVTDYVKLDLDGMMPTTGSAGSDLFGRTAGGDSFLNDIKEITIRVEKYRNNSIGSLWYDPVISPPPPLGGGMIVGVFTEQVRYDGGIHLLNGSTQELKLKGEYPFNPTFEILIPIDNHAEKTGTLQILRSKNNEEPVFDFFLTIDAEAGINQPLF
jgi:hypothetical protein